MFETLEEKLAKRQRGLERDMLTADWRYSKMPDGTRHTLDMPVRKIDDARQQDMLKLLREKFNISARIVHSVSRGGIDVIRVESGRLDDDVNKMGAALYLATPQSWRRNILEKDSGRKATALNLNVEKFSPLQVNYAGWLLSRCNIRTGIVRSASLGGVYVLRLEGEDNIERLRRAFPTLDQRIKAKKFPAPKRP